MKKIFDTLLLALMIVSIIIILPAFAATISIEPSQGTIYQGTTTEFKLVLDSAPDGVSGYSLNLVLSNPGVGEITGVVFPPWEALNNTTFLSGGVVRMSGVDISKMVEPGAKEILLGTVTVRGVSHGTTGVSVNTIKMDADGGGIVTPLVTDAQLAVEGGSTVIPTSPSSGSSNAGGGGGGVSSSAISGTTATGILTSVQPVQSSIVMTVGTQNAGIQTVTREVPVESSIPSKITTPVSNEPIQTEHSSSFPWLIVVGIIIVFGVIVGLIFFNSRKGL